MHTGPTLEDVSVPYEYETSLFVPKPSAADFVTEPKPHARAKDIGSRARDPLLWQGRGIVRKKTTAPKTNSLLGVRLQARRA